jgi:hypothetical protein
VAFGKWAHDLRMVHDKCRIDTLNFNKLFHQLNSKENQWRR